MGAGLGLHGGVSVMSDIGRLAAEIVRQGKSHDIEDFDGECNWLARCVADARDNVKADRAQQAGSGEGVAPQVMARVSHLADGSVICHLNSVGSSLPDHAPLYAHSDGSGEAVAEVVDGLPGGIRWRLSSLPLKPGAKLYTHPSASVPEGWKHTLEEALAMMTGQPMTLERQADAVTGMRNLIASKSENCSVRELVKWCRKIGYPVVSKGGAQVIDRMHAALARVESQLTAAPGPVSNETEVKLTALLGVMCGWFETLTDIAGWTPDNAGSAWAGYRAAKEAMLSHNAPQPEEKGDE